MTVLAAIFLIAHIKQAFIGVYPKGMPEWRVLRSGTRSVRVSIHKNPNIPLCGTTESSTIYLGP
jgi:hypothetical protein